MVESKALSTAILMLVDDLFESVVLINIFRRNQAIIFHGFPRFLLKIDIRYE